MFWVSNKVKKPKCHEYTQREEDGEEMKTNKESVIKQDKYGKPQAFFSVDISKSSVSTVENQVINPLKIPENKTVRSPNQALKKNCALNKPKNYKVKQKVSKSKTNKKTLMGQTNKIKNYFEALTKVEENKNIHFQSVEVGTKSLTKQASQVGLTLQVSAPNLPGEIIPRQHKPNPDKKILAVLCKQDKLVIEKPQTAERFGEDPAKPKK